MKEFIVAGFAGQLRGWWDNVLTLDHQRTILTATKMVRNPIKNEQGVDTYTDTVAPNAVYTLLTAIVQAFIGSNPAAIERNKDLLINLKCPTLTHFRWYKDVFLTKIMLRPDANADFWKDMLSL